MKTYWRWAGRLLGAAAVLLAGFLALGWWISEHDLAQRYVIDDPPLPTPDPLHRRQGQHLYVTRGCADCHGEDGSGKDLFDAGPVIHVVAPNITPAGLAGRYDLDGIGRAIRHGLRDDGSPLVFMPSTDYTELSDQDTALLAAYVLALPAVEHQPGATEIRLLGRVLHMLGQFPLIPAQEIDHAPRQRHAPPAQATAQYGFYLAQVCTGCHGIDFAGLKVGPPSAPAAADLRPGAAMAGWSEADFKRAMRAGQRPDGSALDAFMPWPSLGKMTDVELEALWLYFETLPSAD